MPLNPLTAGPQPPFNTPSQKPPGQERMMEPRPDHGEKSYKGSGRLAGRKAVITGGDSGIGRAVAIAYAREGADVLISYLDEHEDAKATEALVTAEGRKCVLMPGDVQDHAHCTSIIERAVKDLGGIDILVNNAAFQKAHENVDEITPEELDKVFRTNVFAPFFLIQAAAAHMPPGGAIIITASVNADKPNKTLVHYAATKGALQNLVGGFSQALADKGIRVNCVAPGPIWTPLIPSTMMEEQVKDFGSKVPFKRPGQPAEVAPPYVMLASDESTYISGATIAVTGGTPII